jgi:hypothetical protein|tara:strand:- start:10 stop:294 length:285 start_codon:yes stop_codon:yes gene_type:complete
MIHVALTLMGGVVQVQIDGKDVTCKGSIDNFTREYPLEDLILVGARNNRLKGREDREKHFNMMESLEHEEDVYDYVISEFTKQGFHIIGEKRIG